MNVEEVRAVVLQVEGSNCEDETVHAFRRLGAQAERVHLKQLTGEVSDPSLRRSLRDYHILAIPGGFSSGDYVRAGAIWAARLKSRLAKDLVEFVEEGRPVLGICNGFQVLVEMGLLPGFGGPMPDAPEAVLATNDSAHYECRPVYLRHENGGTCVATAGLPKGARLLIPAAHTEGKLLFPQEKEEAWLRELAANDQIVFRYVDEEGNPASYPWNPNGAVDGIAALCNRRGNVVGIMPHPERTYFRYLHPDWTRGGDPARPGDGRLIFESVVDYARRHG